MNGNTYTGAVVVVGADVAVMGVVVGVVVEGVDVDGRVLGGADGVAVGVITTGDVAIVPTGVSDVHAASSNAPVPKTAIIEREVEGATLPVSQADNRWGGSRRCSMVAS